MSDTHLGAKPYGIPEREEDFKVVFENVIKIIVDEVKPDLVVHSGDLFDTPRPAPDTIETALRGVRRLTDVGIHFICIWGNHDMPKESGRISPSLLVQNVSGKGKAEVLAPFSGFSSVITLDGVLFCGIPHLRVEHHQTLGEFLKRCGDEASNYKRSVLLIHQGMRGDIHDGGAEITQDDIPPVFSYIAAGHVHTARLRSFGRGYLAYAGATEVTMETDINQPEGFGFWVVDIEDERVKTPQRIKILTRPHKVFRIDSDEGLEELKNSPLDGRPVIIVHMTSEMFKKFNIAMVGDKPLQGMLRERAFLVRKTIHEEKDLAVPLPKVDKDNFIIKVMEESVQRLFKDNPEKEAILELAKNLYFTYLDGNSLKNVQDRIDKFTQSI